MEGGPSCIFELTRTFLPFHSIGTTSKYIAKTRAAGKKERERRERKKGQGKREGEGEDREEKISSVRYKPRSASCHTCHVI